MTQSTPNPRPVGGNESAPTEPHAYVGWPSPSRWRTCQVCGRGANASIHKPTQEQIDAISGSAYTHRTPTDPGRSTEVER